MWKTVSEMFAGRLALALLMAAPLASCVSTADKQDEALMKSQLTRLDERVAFMYKNTKAQADIKADLEELSQAVMVIRGQMDEYNQRSQMLAERLEMIESSINQLSVAYRNEALEKAAKTNVRLEEIREEFKKLSIETRAFIQLMEKRSGITWESHRRAMEKIAEAEGAALPPPSPPPSAQEPAPGGTAAPGAMDSGELYKNSYNAYLRGDFESAIRGFREYLEKYPDTDLSDNAAYWIGESYYSMKDFDRAATAFDDMASKYPKSNKAPSALLKSALALLELNAADPAIDRLKKILDNYPASNEAIQASERLSSMGVAYPR